MPIKFNSIIPQVGLITQDTSEILRILLVDTSSTGKKRPWKLRKTQSEQLASSYKRLGFEKKAIRVRECGNLLNFVECPSGHEKKLMTASFCRDRLCPMCQWRRSLVIAYQVRLVAHTAVAKKPDLRFIFLTLTARNVEGGKLSEEIYKYFEGWKRLALKSQFKRSVVGWARALEIKHNRETDTYHPHFHVLLAVEAGYFNGQNYIKQSDWAQMWKESMQLDYDPVVDVRKVKSRTGSPEDIGGVSAELIKYASKPEDFIIQGDEIATDEAVSVLMGALKGRRLLGWGGCLKTIWSELRKVGKVQDAEAEDADLVHVEDVPKDCTCSVCGSTMLSELYQWNPGFKEYYGMGLNKRRKHVG